MKPLINLNSTKTSLSYFEREIQWIFIPTWYWTMLTKSWGFDQCLSCWSREYLYLHDIGECLQNHGFLSIFLSEVRFWSTVASLAFEQIGIFHMSYFVSVYWVVACLVLDFCRKTQQQFNTPELRVWFLQSVFDP